MDDRDTSRLDSAVPGPDVCNIVNLVSFPVLSQIKPQAPL